MNDLTGLCSNIGSNPNEMQQDNDRTDFMGQMNALFEEPCSPFPEEQAQCSIQLEQIQNDDYEIALVPCWNRTRRTGSIVNPSTTVDRVLLLPLTWRELLDRIRRELNLSSSAERNMITRFGDVRVNFLTMEITRSEKPVVLTAKEFKLLRFLVKTPERVFSRNELLTEVWGYNNYPSTRTVDNHICMLRQKLEPSPARPIHFLTMHGMGYKFVP